MKKKPKQQAVSNKIKKIMDEGVRRNTHKPLSKTNKRRPVDVGQAAAIAYSMLGKKKRKTAGLGTTRQHYRMALPKGSGSKVEVKEKRKAKKRKAKKSK